MLGSSPQSGLWASELGLPYVFADFINPAGMDVARQYRAGFQPDANGRAGPYLIVAVAAICGETDEQANHLAASHRMLLELLHRGQQIAVPSVDKAMRYFAEQEQSPFSLTMNRRLIAGSPCTVRNEIEAVANQYDADEVMIVSIMHDHEARRQSYKCIAEAFELSNPARQVSLTA